MSTHRLHTILNYCIATIWLANGLFCKVLNLVPRHQQIVGRIVGEQFARPLTLGIGIAEMGMAIWILSGIKSRLNALAQIVVVAVMNIMEYFLVPDLLLWGKFNSLFALLLILVVYFNEFHLKKNKRL
ncbi:MAG: DoxX-like family protein [Bacteroidetes bacterium]|nr:DoxX-like family protein [Bacteroidota bacterium]